MRCVAPHLPSSDRRALLRSTHTDALRRRAWMDGPPSKGALKRFRNSIAELRLMNEGRQLVFFNGRCYGQLARRQCAPSHAERAHGAIPRSAWDRENEVNRTTVSRDGSWWRRARDGRDEQWVRYAATCRSLDSASSGSYARREASQRSTSATVMLLRAA